MKQYNDITVVLSLRLNGNQIDTTEKRFRCINCSKVVFAYSGDIVKVQDIVNTEANGVAIACSGQTVRFIGGIDKRKKCLECNRMHDYNIGGAIITEQCNNRYIINP